MEGSTLKKNFQILLEYIKLNQGYRKKKKVFQIQEKRYNFKIIIKFVM